MEDLIKAAATQGLGYLMFVFLFIWVLKKQENRDINSEAREKKYQEIISDLTCNVNIKLDKLLDKREV